MLTKASYAFAFIQRASTATFHTKPLLITKK